MKRALRTRRATNPRAGLTLVELVLAAGLLAILLAAVFKLLDQFMGVWEKAELRRTDVEQASGVSELFASDLDALEAGPRGDLLAEWVFFDLDGDGVKEAKWPRVRLVRHATDAELARLQAGQADKLVGEGLIEVLWAVTPAFPGTRNADERPLGLLWRGERVVGPPRGADISFFDAKFIGANGQPRPGSAHVVTGGVLWVGMQFATALSDLRDGWSLGFAMEQCLPSWDGWLRARADVEKHNWNDPSDFLPKPGLQPNLPRRVRLEIELESAADFKRRTRITRYVSPQDLALELDDGTKVPGAGAFVLLDAEWMEVTGVNGNTMTVKRGQRGTKAQPHDAGSLVHYGRTLVREIPISQHRGEWGR